MDSRESRAWFSKTQREVQATLFLVRAPITFGHSQLEVKFFGNTPKEAERFEEAARIVCKAIAVLDEVLVPSTLQEFERLAKLTMTEGNYVKTLMLRASAQEDCSQYKIHLVPYFESHAIACQRRFASLHSDSCNETGGLLGWLGDREAIVDSWQNESDNPFEESLDNAAKHILMLQKLAGLLSQKWPQETD